MSKKYKRVVHNIQCGFTLIEAMIVASVLVIGFVATNMVLTNLVKARQFATESSQAVRIADAKMEQLRQYSNLTGYAAIASGSSTTTAANGTFTDTWTVTTQTGYKQVDQTVTWTNSDGQSQTISLSGIIGQTDPSQTGLLFNTNWNTTPLPTPGA